jgi:hypothetical protein
MQFRIKENSKVKLLRSENYNYNFNKKTGYFERWGKTKDNDPQFGLPEIADIEICSGKCSGNCIWCYKSNSIDKTSHYMNFEIFKKLFHKLPRSLTQIAFGITDITANLDLKQIFEYCRNNDYQEIIPNVTINGNLMTNDWYDFLAKTCGAVSVSHYNDNKCFNAIYELTNRGLKQVNIHALLSETTYDKCFDLLKKKLKDERLEKLNAIVFLSLKEKGERNDLVRLKDFDKYSKLVSFALKNKIGIGFDSCGSTRFKKYLDNNLKYKEYTKYIEPCESSCFSLYSDDEGNFYPCSFCEGILDWEDGISILKCNDFMEDIWFNEKTNIFRKILLDKCRNCPIFKI